MAKSINTTYHSDATATCSNCKSVFTLGLTQEDLQIEICGICHPFYTGKDSVIDTAGRIQKFQDKLSKVGKAKPKTKKAKKTRKVVQSLNDLLSDEQKDQELSVNVKGADSL